MYRLSDRKYTSLEKLLRTTLVRRAANPSRGVPAEVKTLPPGLYVDIACWCLLCILALAMGMQLKALNRRQEARRVALGRPAEIKDTSVMTLKESRAYKEELKAALRAEGKDVNGLNADSFDDLTDRENPDFFYVRISLSNQATSLLTAIHNRSSNGRLLVKGYIMASL